MAAKGKKVAFTIPYIRALKAEPGREVILWDSAERGLGVRVRPSGAKTWVFQYRLKGRPYRLSLGNAEAVQPATARRLAIKHRAAVAEGKDPAAARAKDRDAKTVSELCDEYLKWLKERKLKPLKATTLVNERSRIESHIRPLLGKKTVESLDSADVIEKFFNDVADGKTAVVRKKSRIGGVPTGGMSAAHRTTDSLGAMLQYAVSKKMLAVNPVRKLTRKRQKPLPPPFSIEAVHRLGKAMQKLEAEGEPVVGIRAVRHLLLSGFRRMEGLTLQWGMVDAASHCTRLPDTKTGPQTRPLGQAALNHLASFKPKDAKPKDYVFAGPGKVGHYVGAPKAWARIAAKADVTDVSLHGLRHWFASAAAGMGFSELIIAGLLGHSVRSVTGRYATTPDSAIVLAADQVSQHLWDALDGTD